MGSMSTKTPPQGKATSRLTERDRRVLDTTFSIDSRALSVVRILFGLFILIEAFTLGAPEWEPEGLFGTLASYGHLLVVPFALMLMLGYRTKVAVVLCWLVYSLRVRGDLLDVAAEVSVGDYIMTLALFWMMFLPLGRHLSLDARREPAGPIRFVSLASAALLFQVFIIYFSAGLLKETGEWVGEATAMQSILSVPEFNSSLGEWMLQFPAVLSVMSIATIALEVIGGILVIFPGKSLPTRRMIVAPMFIALHVGIALFMDLGVFPFICMAVWLLFMPAKFWDWVWARLFRDTTPSVLQVDSNKWRALVVGVAIVIAAVSNILTWMYFPEFDGWVQGWQNMATYLLLYQQWAMFSVPSSL